MTVDNCILGSRVALQDNPTHKICFHVTNVQVFFQTILAVLSLLKKMIMLIGSHKVREHNVEISLIQRNQYASHTF